MARIFICFLMAVVGALGSARAAAYDISFSPISGAPSGFTASGSFNYTPSSGFSNFLVTADGLNFDLTSSANDETINTLDACSNGLSGAAYTFDILTTCNSVAFTGSYNTADVGFNLFHGIGNYFGFYLGGPDHIDSVGFYGVVGAGSSSAVSSINFVQGGFAVSQVSVPEPSSLMLLGTAILGLILAFRTGVRAVRR